MRNTKIEWSDDTWNPVTGCWHKCEYCYARRMAERYGGGGTWDALEKGRKEFPTVELDEPVMREQKSGKTVKAAYPYFFIPTLHRYRLDEYKKAKGRTIFVCSMADLFGEWVPDGWIEEVFDACRAAPQHRYLFLTKAPERLYKLASDGKLPDGENFWYGSTVTGPNIRMFDAAGYNTFLSIEPLLAPLNACMGTFRGARWIIIGPETGNRKGKVMPKKEWVDNICKSADFSCAAVFMKDKLAPIVGEKNMRREFPWDRA